MVMLGIIRKMWRYIYSCVRMWGLLLLLPSIIILFPLLLLISIAEFALLDIPWLFMVCIEDGSFRHLGSNIHYLMYHL